MLTTASLKLKKLSKSMELKSESLKKDYSLFTPRMSAINSIAKSVKYNNLSFISGEELCKLRRQPQDPLQNPQFSTAKNNMTGMRKRYDQVNQQKLYLENKIQRLTEQKNKLLTLSKEFEENKTYGKQKVSLLQSELNDIKMKLIDKEFERLSMGQLQDGINHDKIVYDKRKYDMQKQLRNLAIKLKSIKEQNIHQAQQNDRAIKVYEKLVQKLNSQNKQRQEHINSMESKIFQIENINDSSIMRKSKMEAIAKITMCQRNPDQKGWLNVYRTHKLLENLLKSKIEREMQKFCTVQTAFKNIKIATGVTDADTMVKKFLSKAEIYVDLLSKITDNQKQIQMLKMDGQNLFKSITKLDQHFQQQALKNQDQNLRQSLKQAEFYDDKKHRCQYQKIKLKQYLFKQLNRLNQSQPNQIQGLKTEFDTQDKLKEKFIQHLKALTIMVENCQKLQIGKDNLKQNLHQVFFEDVSNKIFRIKPDIPVMNPSVNDKNLAADQLEYTYPFEEEQITTTNDESQTIDYQRQALLKSNQKFMRELKLKIEEQKKLIVENLVKNSKEKAIPVVVKKAQPSGE